MTAELFYFFYSVELFFLFFFFLCSSSFPSRVKPTSYVRGRKLHVRVPRAARDRVKRPVFPIEFNARGRDRIALNRRFSFPSPPRDVALFCTPTYTHYTTQAYIIIMYVYIFYPAHTGLETVRVHICTIITYCTVSSDRFIKKKLRIYLSITFARPRSTAVSPVPRAFLRFVRFRSGGAKIFLATTEMWILASRKCHRPINM